ncbi:1-deoxy-D-xylulose-5-phosphate reductoisomerase [Candidatus Peregrinibacteria bacterium]|nr:1-deoxy-D-xylulose-5-phosphate reductoisomerase [Candidatus Peregrinibacteria bacterium]
MQKVVVLGSTGSLGIQTLEILKKYPEHFRVIGLSANIQADLLKKQAKKFKTKNFLLAAKARSSAQALVRLATSREADIIINVLAGTAGIAPTLAALKAGKTILLGNKESLFAEGKKIMKIIHSQKKFDKTSSLIPLDSEHNAIFEILQKFPHKKIKKIIIPCSGGPFYGKSTAALARVTPTQALKHPRYKMGKKISVESATLINKGLEIIEAHHLFALPLAKIATVFHPECRIHGAVEFEKTTHTMAYFAKPDMREHLENALRRSAGLPLKNLKIKTLKSAATAKKFLKPLRPGALKGLALVLKVFKKSKNSSRKLKNFLLHEEKIIKKFLTKKIKFTEIFKP